MDPSGRRWEALGKAPSERRLSWTAAPGTVPSELHWEEPDKDPSERHWEELDKGPSGLRQSWTAVPGTVPSELHTSWMRTPVLKQ